MPAPPSSSTDLPPPSKRPPSNPKKVVLEVKGEAQLLSLSEKLEAAGVRHKLWVEQPENFPTCLATKPYRRSAVGQHLKKLQLCKAALGGAGGAAGAGAGGAAAK
jgi:hypothetical protein